MNSKIKRWALLAIAPVALLAITACGSDDTPASFSEADAPFEVSSESTEQIEPALAGSAGGDEFESVFTAPDGGTDEIIAALENFRVMLSDEENAIGDFVHLWVTVERVGIQQGGEATTTEGWLEFEVPEETQISDLVELQGENATELISAEVPFGSYGKIFIHTSDVRGELLSGEMVELKLPSDKLQLNQPFEISEDSLTTFVFDITVVAAGNEKSGIKYILKPVIGESGPDEPFTEKESKGKGGPPEGRGKPSDPPSSATTTQAAIAADDKRGEPSAIANLPASRSPTGSSAPQPSSDREP